MSEAPPAESRLLRSFRPSRTLTLDLITSYVASFARAGSMLAIVALLGHRTTTGYLAAFLFLRSMLSFLNNGFVGAGPAAIAAIRVPDEPPLAEIAGTPIETASPLIAATTAAVLSYESRVRLAEPVPETTSTWSALLLSSVVPAIVMFVLVAFCVPLLVDGTAPFLPSRPLMVAGFSYAFAGGFLARLASDSAGGVLQSRNLLWLDNLLVSSAEMLWVAISFAGSNRQFAETFRGIADAYLLSGALLFGGRWLASAAMLIGYESWAAGLRSAVTLRFLAVAGALAFASLGDFLYAPANYVIIRRFLDPLLIADYGPALQVDSLLLLAVTALASVILPRAVALYETRNFAELRRAYIAATVVGTLLLAGGAGVFLTFSGPLLRLWLGDVPSGTRAILPFVLAHTVLGGTASIGRSVLIGMGRLRVYTVVTLGAGVFNLSLVLLLVTVFGFGLRGIVFATILTVTLRNAVWAPWYILTRLNRKIGLAVGE